jgi:hypothetical protein
MAALFGARAISETAPRTDLKRRSEDILEFERWRGNSYDMGRQ